MADYLSAEISATCAALGYYDGTKYLLERDCKETLKDLIRYLKRDDDTHQIRRFLGNTKLVQTDLVKIIIEHSDKPELFDVLLRLTVNLTTPALLLYNQELPTDKESRNNYLEIIGHLQSTKNALGDELFWTTICKQLTAILDIPSMERTEEKGLVVERILTLVRNALWVPVDVEGEKRTESEGTIHDQLLFALHVSGMVDLFLYIASNRDEQHYQLHILEIVSLMLREQNAAELASSGMQRSALEKERDEANLVAVREKAKMEKIERARKYAGSRHSRFGGTFVVTNMKAIGDHNMICHKPFPKLEDLQFSQSKKKLKRPKNKAAMVDPEAERRSALSVRLFLREFCIEFLNGAYNPVMKYARSCIMGTDRAQENDESYYLFALRFFMEFNRHHKFEIKYVSETISTEIFYLVQRQVEHYYEMIVVDKTKVPLWSRRLHLALKAYRELLNTINAMDTSKDDGVRRSSKVMKSNIFYVPEYRETLLSQLLGYNDVKMSRRYLEDLIETVHTFLKMLERYCGKGRGMVVQRIKNKQRRRTKQPKKPQAPAVASIEDRWNAVAEQLAVAIQSGTIPEVMPFDATLETPIDDQKADAMMRIQRFLRRTQPEEAVGLIRAAREVWPENDSFGSAEMSPEEELAALRAIFLADFSGVAGYVDADETVSGGGGSLTGNTEPGDLEVGEGSNEDEEEEEARRVEEADFEFKDFLHRFVNVKVVRACALLLKNFAENTVKVNYSVVKLLHRIAVECKMPAMMFQATIFQIFQQIFESKNPEHKELAKFAKFIVRKFTEVAKTNPKVYMELLFWKTTKEANELVEGYGSGATSEKQTRGVWTESEEDELRVLFMEHQTNKHPQDLIDWLLDHVTNETRTRRGVMKKLKEMHLIVNSKAIRNEIQKRLPKEWGEDEIAQLTEIWENVKDDEDPIDMIYTELRLKRPKPKIKEKLLEIGLAKDRKELRKKRSKKNGAGKSDGRNESGSESDSENEGDDDEVSEVSARRAPPKKNTKKRVVIPKSKNRPTMIYTNAQLSGLLKHVLENHGQEALEWIKESLEDVVDDRDEESTEGVPLVPITDVANAAMDSPSFQRFLRALGIEPPADEQEIYWRIPAHMLTSTIRKRCDLIADALEGKFVEEEESQPPASDVQNESDDDDVDIFENVKKYFRPRDNAADAEGHVEEVRASGSGVVRRRTSAKTARKGTDFESEEQEAEKVIAVADESNDVTVVSADEPSQTNGSRLRSILIDSDSDHDAREPTNPDDPKRVRSDNSEHEESPAPKKRRLIDSDDEADQATPEVPSRRAMLISDDED